MNKEYKTFRLLKYNQKHYEKNPEILTFPAFNVE